MTIALIVLALLAAAAVVATVVQITRDGYGRIPTRPSLTAHLDAPAEAEPVVSSASEQPLPARDRVITGTRAAALPR